MEWSIASFERKQMVGVWLLVVMLAYPKYEREGGSIKCLGKDMIHIKAEGV